MPAVMTKVIIDFCRWAGKTEKKRGKKTLITFHKQIVKEYCEPNFC
jgi:hypothetical protein